MSTIGQCVFLHNISHQKSTYNMHSCAIGEKKRAKTYFLPPGTRLWLYTHIRCRLRVCRRAVVRCANAGSVPAGVLGSCHRNNCQCICQALDVAAISYPSLRGRPPIRPGLYARELWCVHGAICMQLLSALACLQPRLMPTPMLACYGWGRVHVPHDRATWPRTC